MSAEKQIISVLRAVQVGFEISRDIAEETGLPLAHVSAYLSELNAVGVVRIVSRRAPRAGRLFHRYAPAAV